jgi:hypothetical protein
MAFIRDPLKQDEGQQSGGVIGTDGQQIAGDQAGAKPVSNWTNLNKYIEGNQGSGEKIADKMLEQGNKDINAAGEANKAFGTQATSQVNSGIKQDNGYSDLFSSGDLSNVSDQQKNDYSAWKQKPNYSGPNNAAEAQGYGEASQATNTAKNQAAKSATQESQYGLAKESLGKGNQNYNGGMGILDTVLARQTGGGQKIDDFNTKNTAANIQSGLDNTSKQINDSISAAGSQGQANVDKVNKAMQDRLGSYQSQLAAREAANKNSGENMYEQDQNLADYASDAELQALNNLSGFGANMDQNQRNELLNRSGRSKQTVAQGNAITAPDRNAVTALENNSILDQILKAPETKNGATVIDPNAQFGTQYDAFGNPL